MCDSSTDARFIRATILYLFIDALNKHTVGAYCVFPTLSIEPVLNNSLYFIIRLKFFIV